MPPLHQGTSRILHRHLADRPAVRHSRPGACSRCQRDLRAGSSNRLARAPLGQALIITTDCGWAQRGDGPREEIRPGDVVWFASGEKHWHGATATTAMTHIAIQEKLEGKTVDWLEKVSDDQYGA